MTRQRYLVRVRYFPDLEEPSLILAGTDAGLICLSAWFHDLAAGGYRKLLLQREPWVQVARDTSVAIAVEDLPRGPVAESNGNWKLLWGITPAQAAHFSRRIRKLVDSEDRGHVELDNGVRREPRVLASLNEFTPALFQAGAA